MNAKIKFNRPLPLVVSVPDNVYEIWVDYGESTHAWHVAVGRLGDRFKRSITVGKPTRHELEQALSAGVELIEDPAAQIVATELVTQKRAEFVPAAA
ncbi:MAG TPA: hypothetical protein VHO24_11850 [Opitutaceae bacterium]|nr:hypothetical protein [Opitutaceae bacterium]